MSDNMNSNPEKKCAFCKATARFQTISYVEHLGDVAVTIPSIQAFRCDSCNEVEVTSALMKEIEVRAAVTALHDLPSINGAVLRYARKAAALRQIDVARLLGVTPATVSRWETDAEPIQRNTHLAMLAVLQVVASGRDPLLSMLSAHTRGLTAIAKTG